MTTLGHLLSKHAAIIGVNEIGREILDGVVLALKHLGKLSRGNLGNCAVCDVDGGHEESNRKKYPHELTIACAAEQTWSYGRGVARYLRGGAKRFASYAALSACPS